ncbi:MAG: sterol desaturase family protein [Flavobacteriales bacterium]|nr:sterol desaturase family protein [Flavobacteriales bacterium]MDW8409281.1 sterol desaturase family protein [Flavobacteriales bacterium]
MLESASIVLWALPYFGVLLGLELLADSRNGWRYYKSLRDTLSNLYIGIGEVLLSLVIKTAMIGVYDLVSRRFSLFSIPDNFWTAMVFFILFDFIYYWAHRLGHEVNFMWAGHVPHHSSEAFNLTVALRQPWFQVLTTWFLFIPLAILGFSTQMLIVVSALDILYQYWIHTSYIKKLPAWVEFIFNTPSHHRVHHGRQPKYLDKNHGGVLIIWDRLFGTFQAEEETPEYGITHPLRSWNPLYANIHHFGEILHFMTSENNWKSKIMTLWMSPAKFSDFSFKIREPSKISIKKDPTLNLTEKMFFFWQFGHFLGQALFLLAIASKTPVSFWSALLIFLLWHILSMGFWWDGKHQAYSSESIRLMCVTIFSIILLSHVWTLPPICYSFGYYLIFYSVLTFLIIHHKAILANEA